MVMQCSKCYIRKNTFRGVIHTLDIRRICPVTPLDRITEQYEESFSYSVLKLVIPYRVPSCVRQ